MKIFLQVIFLLALISILFISGNDSTTLKNRNEIVLSTGEEPGPDQRPSEWDFIKRTYPFYKADADAYVNAIQQAKLLAEETRIKRLSKGQTAVQWQFAGPFNIGGRVVDIEFDPVNPNNVYAGFATGGVFKSTDTGVTWFPVFDEAAVLTVGDIAIDPINPNIIYVGTGESNGGHNNFPGGGVYKSTDAGTTWNFLGLSATTSIGRVIVHPVNTNIIYLAAVGSYFSPNPERGIYKSTNGGSTWEQNLFISDSTGAIDIVIDPNNPDRLMVSMWERVRRPNSSHLYGPSSGIYRTTNSGDSWSPVTSGLPDPSSTNVGRIGLSISKSNPEIVYALYGDGSNIISLFKTTNFGNSWIDVDTDGELQDGTAGFSWYFGQVRVHPTNPNTVYVMDVAFMRSTNSGTTWPIIYGYGGPDHLHVDHHALAFHPTNPNYILNGNDGGINISSDGGVNWSNAAHIPATQFYEIGLDANNPQKLYGGTQDNGTNRTQDGGLSNWQNIFGGDGFYVIVDHSNPNIIYAESQNGGLGKSVDGGFNWNYDVLNGVSSSEPTNWSTPVIMDPVTPTKLYYGTNFLYRTTNGASSWAKISPALTDWVSGRRLGTITTIAVAPTNTNVIYVGTDDAHVWVTTNNGTNWTEISDGLPDRWVTRVVVDPNDENIVYVTFSGLKWRDPQPHVFRSTNKGSNWTDISSNLPDAPVNAFAVDNNNANRLYLGSDVGMYVSFNTGASWEVLGEGLPVLPIGDIKIHPTANYLAAGTYGRSMYKIDLNAVTNVESTSSAINNFTLEQNYPNPFNPTTKIKFSISDVETGHAPSLQMVTLNIYDVLGKKVTTLINEEKPAGSYEVTFNGEGLASGVYYYKLTSTPGGGQAGKYTQTKKMILLR
ncbi:MAG: T9SS type A sorting domain-containing protein [Ignavibacteriales bacterium]|nr:MAG: T9SS type A sorting domain-containing protein [Ignavibacteriales bacterium]